MEPSQPLVWLLSHIGVSCVRSHRQMMPFMHKIRSILTTARWVPPCTQIPPPQDVSPTNLWIRSIDNFLLIMHICGLTVCAASNKHSPLWWKADTSSLMKLWVPPCTWITPTRDVMPINLHIGAIAIYPWSTGTSICLLCVHWRKNIADDTQNWIRSQPCKNSKLLHSDLHNIKSITQ